MSQVQHYRMELNDLLTHYRAGDMTAKGALRIYFRIRLAEGWQCRIKPKQIREFFSKFSDRKGQNEDMSRSTFWRAMYELQEEGEISFKEPETLVIRLIQSNSEHPSQKYDEGPEFGTRAQNLGQGPRIWDEQDSEVLPDKDSSDSTNSYQIYSNFSHSEGDEEEKINGTGQEEETAKDLNQVQAIITQPVQDPIASFKSSEAALAKVSTPDPFFARQPQQRHAFLEYDGENTPWLNPPRRKNDIYFKPEFMQWQGSRWMQKFQKQDIFGAIADFKSSLINEPERIPGRWEEYEQHMVTHAVNIQNRIEAGATITESEQQKMVTHLPNITSALNQTQQVLAPTTETRALAPAITVNAIPVLQTEAHAENNGAYTNLVQESEPLTPEEIEANRKRFSEALKGVLGKKQMPRSEDKPKEASIKPKNLTQAREMMLDPVMRSEAVRWANTNGYQVDFESLEILEF